MKLYQELRDLLPLNYNVILKTCKANYQCNYSEFYDIPYIRKAIQNKNYVIIKSKDGNKLLIGEGENQFLYIDTKNRIKKIDDFSLNQIWDGEAIIITEKINNDKLKNLFIIDYSESDWDKKEIESLKPILDQLVIGEYFLPKSPLILIFKNKTDEEIKKGIRAKTYDIHICIYDKNKPIEALFHELGHIYWRDVMNDSDRLIFRTYFLNLSKTNLPLIYTNDWLITNEEEAFCNIYTYFLQSKYIDERYLDILKYYDCNGYNSIIKVFKQIHNRDIREQEWNQTTKSISFIVNNFNPKTFKIIKNNQIILKSFIDSQYKDFFVKIPKDKIQKVVKKFSKSGLKLVEIFSENEQLIIPIDSQNIFKPEYLNIMKNKTNLRIEDKYVL